MATVDRKDTGTERPRFCPECGHPAGDANFCPGCGHNMGFAADRTLADPSVQPPAGGRRPRVALIAACAALGVAAVAVAAVILLSGGSGSKTTGHTSASPYRQQLAKVLAPLIRANQTLSGALTSVDGTPPSIRTAKTDAAQALAALVASHGALAVLSPPSSEAGLSAQVQQALTTDNGYLQAVASTLATPNGTSTGQLQTLATGAQSALDPLDAVTSGASTSVSGTGNLVSWAQGASGQAKAHTSTPSITSTTTVSATSSSGGSSAGSGGRVPVLSTVGMGCSPGRTPVARSRRTYRARGRAAAGAARLRRSRR